MSNQQEFLTFKLGKEEYAVEIMRVQEIRGWQEPSPLPQVPPFVKGVVDLRGSIVPIIDLRQRFNLPQSYDGTTVVIVVNVKTRIGDRVIGLVVDAVSDVKTLDLDNLQPPPDISDSIDSQFIRGLTTVFDQLSPTSGQTDEQKKNKKGRMVVILDIDLIASDGLIEEITQQQA
ncbi:chemotaxis protein CheW [Thiomicrorhabdus indica]|uniref:chemotaxis protein CheW n=1 Tax=Thiomicrorhabdus indica TaxID=2267253 RepID=UPI00102DB38F|nr:chemotaxis protein CheW [Thiomicrorhabdus indica]